MVVEELEIMSISADRDLHARERIDPIVVGRYAEHMRAGAVFPPVHVFRVSDRGNGFFLTGGFHRYHAALEAGRGTILAEVTDGTYAEAMWSAAGENKEWDRADGPDYGGDGVGGH